jgi:putative tryptophan/tyrosine transport system substrate-binding protein
VAFRDALAMSGIARRKFILLSGGAIAVWPFPNDARSEPIPVVGILYAGSSGGGSPTSWEAFRQGVRDAGYIEGQNISFEFRFADNRPEILPELAADLVRRRVAVIVVPGSTVAVRAAMAATTTIPIIFMNASDPVQAGLVASLSRPGGNVTGVTDMGIDLAKKRLGLLHEMAPEAKRIGALTTELLAPQVVKELQEAAGAVALQIEIMKAGTSQEIDAAFDAFRKKQVQALWVSPGSLFLNNRIQITKLAAEHALPAIYPLREFTEAGGLMSYGSSIADRSRQAGTYVARILKGEKPAELPVMRNTTFDLVINLQTAHALGLKVPIVLHTEAKEVIE